ncbi:MAG TPA: glycosyltransferase family 2 protein [Bryobacteraceae bacterium]|jgi:glycosyltransferase involved in cell wall biosynthesis
MTVSVVIATHNRRALLQEAVATVRDQTFDEWELLIVDDASTDDTWAWLGTLHAPCIRVLRQERRQERSAARNRGLAEARGDLIMFLDDDDLLRPCALAELSAAMRAHPEAIAAAGTCRILWPSGDSVKVYRPAKPVVRNIWRELLYGQVWANSGMCLFRTCIVRDCGGYDSAFNCCEDRKLWLQLSRLGPVVCIPRVVMEYRVHPGQYKSADIDAIRQAMWRGFIDSLPPEDRRIALGTRRAAEMVEISTSARSKRCFARALRTQIAACAAAPWLLSSPLTARPTWWSLKKSLLRVTAP